MTSQIVHARTATDSLYSFDIKGMMWTRSSDHDIIGLPRVNGSVLLVLPTVEVGQRILIESADGTWVSTSPVTETWTEDVPDTQSA
jgi:hypothetical protein